MRTMLMMAALVLPWIAQDAKDAEKWIKELGSESFEAREKASAELKKIGAPALEALKKAAAESTDAEVRQRAADLVKEIEKPTPTKPAKPAAPGRLGGRAATVQVQSINGDSTYTITPAGGTPFTFRKSAGGAVELDTTDGDGKEQSVKSDTLDAFLKDHKELAESHGITKDGINFAGASIDFDGNPMKGIRIFRAVPFKNGDEDELEERMQELMDGFTVRPPMRAAGATFEAVTEVLRSQLEIAEGQGLVVKSVGEDTVASRAGLKKHDIVLEVDGAKVAKSKDLKELKKDSKVLVLRGGKKVSLNETK